MRIFRIAQEEDLLMGAMNDMLMGWYYTGPSADITTSIVSSLSQEAARVGFTFQWAPMPDGDIICRVPTGGEAILPKTTGGLTRGSIGRYLSLGKAYQGSGPNGYALFTPEYVVEHWPEIMDITLDWREEP